MKDQNVFVIILDTFCCQYPWLDEDKIIKGSHTFSCHCMCRWKFAFIVEYFKMYTFACVCPPCRLQFIEICAALCALRFILWLKCCHYKPTWALFQWCLYCMTLRPQLASVCQEGKVNTSSENILAENYGAQSTILCNGSSQSSVSLLNLLIWSVELFLEWEHVSCRYIAHTLSKENIFCFQISR